MDTPHITINVYEQGDEAEINQLIKTVFDEFEAPGYTPAGNDFFYQYISPGNILKRQLQEKTLWVARHGSKITGMIEMRDKQWISLLFVDKSFHRQGIATALVHTAIAGMGDKYTEINAIFVNSSPYAVTVYERFGFRAFDEFRVTEGIRYLPMKMTLKKKNVRKIKSSNI